MGSASVFMEYDNSTGTDDFSKTDFPNGYIFRSISREEGYLWEYVMDEAFGDYKAGTFEFVMVENYSYLPERVYILFDEKHVPCGTASAWEQPWHWGKDCGFIIFVGVIPSHRSKGLGTQMVRYLCEVIKKRGQQSVLLDVDSDNYSAIKSYTNAGFKPSLTDKKQDKIWKKIFEQLCITPMDYSTEVRTYCDNPHPPHPYLFELRGQGFDVK